jgi:DNA-binding response OmpR family regulator
MLSNPQAEGSGFGTVLIVEDEVLVSVMIEDFLLDVGASEVIVCGSPDEACVVIRTRSVDCAILDVKIGDTDSFGLADELTHRGVPFFFATATGPDAIVERHRHRPILAKPFSNAQLLEFLHAAIAQSRETVLAVN